MLGEQLVLASCIPFHQQEMDDQEASTASRPEQTKSLGSLEVVNKHTKHNQEDHDLARQEASETFFKIETQFKKIAARYV